MPNLEALSYICSVLQILGLSVLFCWKWLPRFTGALISITGFAAVVKFFLLLPGHQSTFSVIAALAGIGIIVIGCIKAQKGRTQ